jgi:hypothetical protein
VEPGVDGEELAWARARVWAASFPPWSDEQWREINIGLGYRLKGEKETG